MYYKLTLEIIFTNNLYYKRAMITMVQIKSDEDKIHIKVVNINEIYNFAVDDLFI